MSISPIQHHDTHQHTLYRMTCADFDALWTIARGCCQICRTAEPDTIRGKLVIDHAQEYGLFAVRGLLCDKCNALMDRVDQGIEYDPRALTYRMNSWFVLVLRERHADRASEVGRRARERYAS